MAPPVDIQCSDSQNLSSIHENLSTDTSQDCGGPLLVNTNFLSNLALNTFINCSNDIQMHEQNKKQRSSQIQRRPSLNRAIKTREEIFEVSTLDEEEFLRALENNGANSSSVLQSLDLTRSIENLMKYFDEDVSFENNTSNSNILNNKIQEISKTESLKNMKYVNVGKLTGAIPKLKILPLKNEELEENSITSKDEDLEENSITPNDDIISAQENAFKSGIIKKSLNVTNKDPKTPDMNFVNNEKNTVKRCPKESTLQKPKNLYEHLINPTNTANEKKTKSLYDDYKKNFDLISSEENLSIKSLNKKSKISPRIKQFAEIFDRQFSPIKNMKFFENNTTNHKTNTINKNNEKQKIISVNNFDKIDKSITDEKKNPVPLPRLSVSSSSLKKCENNELTSKLNSSDKITKLSVKEKITLFNKIVEDKKPSESSNNSKVDIIKLSQKKAIQDSLGKIEQTLQKMTLKQLNSEEKLHMSNGSNSSTSRKVSKLKQQIENLSQSSTKENGRINVLNSSLDSLAINPATKQKYSSEVFHNLQKVIDDLRTKVKEPKNDSNSCENITEYSHQNYYKPISFSYILNDPPKKIEIDENHIQSLEMVCNSTIAKKIRQKNNTKLASKPYKKTGLKEILGDPVNELSHTNSECNMSKYSKETLKKELKVSEVEKRNSTDMCSCIPIDVYGPPKKIRRTAEDRIGFANPKMATLFYEWLKQGNKLRLERNESAKYKVNSNDMKDRKNVTIPMGFHIQQRIRLKKNSLRRRLKWKHDSSIVEKLLIPPSEDERSSGSSDEKSIKNQLDNPEITTESARDSFMEMDQKLFKLPDATPLELIIPDGRDSFLGIDSNLTRCCDSPSRFFEAYTLTAMSSPTPSEERYSISSKNDLFLSRSCSHLPSGEYESFCNENFIELPEPQIRYNSGHQRWPYLNFNEDHIESITVDSEETDLKYTDLDEKIDQTEDFKSKINITYFSNDVSKGVSFENESTEQEKNCKQFRKTPKKPVTYPIKPKPMNKPSSSQTQIVIKILEGNDDKGLNSSWFKSNQNSNINSVKDKSKFWMRSRSFQITINVFNVKIDDFRKLHFEMQKEESSDNRKLKFGIDDIEFCTKKSQKLSTIRKIPKNSSIFWFSFGECKTYFEGEYMPKKKIEQIFDLLRGSGIEFGINIGNSDKTPKHSSNSDISIPDSNYYTLSPKREKRKSPYKVSNKVSATLYNGKTSDLEPSEFESDDQYLNTSLKNNNINSKKINIANIASCSSDDNGHHYDSVYSDDDDDNPILSSEIELDPLDDLFKWVQDKTCETEAKIKKNGNRLESPLNNSSIQVQIQKERELNRDSEHEHDEYTDQKTMADQKETESQKIDIPKELRINDEIEIKESELNTMLLNKTPEIIVEADMSKVTEPKETQLNQEHSELNHKPESTQSDSDLHHNENDLLMKNSNELEKLHIDLIKIIQSFEENLKPKEGDLIKYSKNVSKLTVLDLCVKTDQYLQDAIKNCKTLL